MLTIIYFFYHLVSVLILLTYSCKIVCSSGGSNKKSHSMWPDTKWTKKQGGGGYTFQNLTEKNCW